MKTKQIVLFPLLLMFASCSFNAGNADTKKEEVADSAEVVDSAKVANLPNEEKTLVINGVDFTFVKVRGGSFYMGAQKNDPKGINYDPQSDTSDYPVHKVSLSDYWIGKTEVTRRQWGAICGYKDKLLEGETEESYEYPIDNVNWPNAVDFTRKLNLIVHKNKQIGDNQNFMLPTDAQWEYAARGGVKSKHYRYSGSNNPDEVAWYDNDSTCGLHLVATKKPNELGIYDMSGNVGEWCSDTYRRYGKEKTVNPKFPYDIRTANLVVIRLGGATTKSTDLRVSARYGEDPEPNGEFPYGLRLVLQ